MKTAGWQTDKDFLLWEQQLAEREAHSVNVYVEQQKPVYAPTWHRLLFVFVGVLVVGGLAYWAVANFAAWLEGL